MPQTLIKGNHCTLVMRKWSFQDISVHCINLELKVCFRLAVSGWLVLNYHMFSCQYKYCHGVTEATVKWADSLHLCFLETFVFYASFA